MPRIPVIARILLAMALGTLVGVGLGPDAAPLGKIGTILIDLIKALAAPLLFLAILDAFLRAELKAKSGAIMVLISATNAAIAIVAGMTIVNLLRPGDHFARFAVRVDPKLLEEFERRSREPIQFVDTLLAYIPTNVLRPFTENAIITIILLAVLGGAALRKVKLEQLAAGRRDFEAVEAVVSTSFRAVEVILGWVVLLIPLAVFASVAKAVGQNGFEVFRGLAIYVAVIVGGLAFQVFVVYQAWIVLVARMPLRRFWRGAAEAVEYALGAASSMATLPVTLRCLDRMRVSPQSARLAACVGTNLNNDGILLYEAMAVLFVAQASGVPLTLGQQLTAAFACVIAGVGISGVPDAGLISLSIVLATVKLPGELVGILFTVDWLIGRCRAMTNVTSDIMVAVLLDRFQGEGEPALDLSGAVSQ